MTTLTDPPGTTTETIEAKPGPLGPPGSAGGPAGTGGPEPEAAALGRATRRGTVAVGLSTLAAAIVVGGVFLGPGARVDASIAGLAGVGLAVLALRLRGSLVTNLALAAGVGVIGLLAVLLTGPSAVVHLTGDVSQAVHQGNFLRPPVPDIPGWHAIVAWLMATVGVVAAWTAFVVGRPTLGVLLPLPLAVVAAISLPPYAQVASGIVVLALVAAALAIVATDDLVGGDDVRPSFGFQARRAARSLAVIGVISGILVVAARSDVLFPKPVYNPATQAQRPRVVPPTNAPQRVLFTVRSASRGPYRTGDLDVYQHGAWYYAPLADAPLNPVPASGVLGQSATGTISATFTIQGYTGSVLPSLANLTGVIATGPKLDFQLRGDLLSIADGQVHPGYRYTITAAALPTLAELDADTRAIPPIERQFLAAPPVPARIEGLISSLRQADPWQTFIALRDHVLNTVTAAGSGIPVAVPPSTVSDMLFGSRRGSPFEITAAIALLSRWAGIPARIGFGFQADPTQMSAGAYVIRPTDAISFPEVFFPGYGWLPVTGTPKHAAANDTNTLAKKDSAVTPSNQFGVELYVPQLTPPPSPLGPIILRIVGGLVLAGLLGWLAFLLAPLLIKARRRARRRAAARLAGPRARLALAYAEWRDATTDFGYRHDTDTPLAFLAHFAPDDEHTELAWLVTRAIWGDLRSAVTPEMAGHAEELSRALRIRLAAGHPATIRLVASLSRVSLRHPYAPDLVASLSKPRKEAVHVPVPATASV